MSDMHMNGHESGNGQSYQSSSAGFNLMPTSELPHKKLNRQQTVILRHLQTKGAITPLIAKYQYDCKGVAAIISQLRGKGWDIKTDRRKDKNGNPFSSYRLPGTQDEDVYQEEHDLSAAETDAAAVEDEQVSARIAPDPYVTETRKHDVEESQPALRPDKVRFIVPLSASETSVTLSRSDFEFMMRIVAEH